MSSNQKFGFSLENYKKLNKDVEDEKTRNQKKENEILNQKPYFFFEQIYQSSKSGARVGRIHTPHGIIETPSFVAVGTNASVKILDNVSMEKFFLKRPNHLQLIFYNTYHLLLHPGPDIIEKAGGLHNYSMRNGPIITDSGGYQVFSMMRNNHIDFNTEQDHTNKHNEVHIHGINRSDNVNLSGSDDASGNLVGACKINVKGETREIMNQEQYRLESDVTIDRKEVAKDPSHQSKMVKELKGGSVKKEWNQNLVIKVSEDGVQFKSYRDGRIVELTPESSVDIQKQLGADIIIPFDELLPQAVSTKKLRESFERTHRWEQRSLERHLQNTKQQAMYCVVHGGTDLELRKESISRLCSLNFDGVAIGGSLGRDRSEFVELLQYMMSLIPKHLPNHVLGIGDFESIPHMVRSGVDTFDSSYPTKLGRHGNFFVHSSEDQNSIGLLKIRNSAYLSEFERPIDPKCTCHTCQNYSLAYLHHLYKSNEPALGLLGTVHNLHFISSRMRKYREQIMNDEI